MLPRSPLSGSETEVSSDPQKQISTLISRRRQSKTVSRKLAILVVLGVLVLGCTGFASQVGFWTSVQGEETEELEEIAQYDWNNSSTQLTRPDSVREIIAIPTVAERQPPQNVLVPNPYYLIEPTFTLEPTAIPTQVIIDTPTSTPTPSPTSTSLPTATLTPEPTITPQPGIKHVVIISIDGLRPDALDLADTPTLDRLRAKGAYCPNAKTVYISETLPSHASMLTGMTPDKHGLLWSLPYMGWPGLNGPTLFSVAHDAGLSTAMVFGKEKLNYLVLPNSVDKLFGADVHDTEVKNEAVEIIQAGLPHILFIHFPDTDRVGHEFGWMSANQFQSITFADGLIGEIVAALESGGYLNNTLLIITADHGGHGFRHGDDSPIDRTIPWLALGPGVPSGVPLTREINIYDTAATAAYALELPCPVNWDGQPVLEIFPVQDAAPAVVSP